MIVSFYLDHGHEGMRDGRYTACARRWINGAREGELLLTGALTQLRWVVGNESGGKVRAPSTLTWLLLPSLEGPSRFSQHLFAAN
jgi:hypothetical protein